MRSRWSRGYEVALEQVDARKRPENCFRCWHCRRVDGLSSCCVCVANVTKNVKPEFIEEPYAGRCPQFWDKKVEERKVASFMGEIDIPLEQGRKESPR